jgi:hypothetical protein
MFGFLLKILRLNTTVFIGIQRKMFLIHFMKKKHDFAQKKMFVFFIYLKTSGEIKDL